MPEELTKLSAVRLASMVRAREVSPVEIVEAHLDRIERVNPKLNAIVTLAPDALDRARQAEAKIMRGEEAGPLHGIPLTIKDTIETKGLKTTSGSQLRAAHLPFEDAPAVARLKAAGAIILGKTNVPEMAIPYECDNPVFGRTNNPHDLGLTSGGSSGGEAAAVCASLTPAGLGSDLAGSIRVPAHFCGIFGLKPTTGLIPASGHFPQAVGPISLGAALGPLARKVEDLSLLLNVLAGLSEAAPSLSTKALDITHTEMRGLRVAIYLDEKRAPVTSETQSVMQSSVRALSEAGLVIVEETPPGLERSIDLWPALFSYASTMQLRSVYAGQEARAGELVRAVLASAAVRPAPSVEEFIGAWVKRDALLGELIQWMEWTPLILAPVGAGPAFEHGARRVHVEGESLSIFRAFSYSRLGNVLGLPSVSVPAGRTRAGLPVGVQIIGPPFAEGALLTAALILEESLGGYIQPKSEVMR